MALNSLALNKTKTKTLIVGTAASANQAKQVVPNSKVVTSAKYSVLEIDHKLIFKEHANQLLKKLPKMFRCRINSESFCLLRNYLEHINPLFSQSISVAYWCTVLLIKNGKNRKSTGTIDPNHFFKKKKVRIDTQIAIKIQNTPSGGTSCLRAFEASGSCFKTNTCPSRCKQLHKHQRNSHTF